MCKKRDKLNVKEPRITASGKERGGLKGVLVERDEDTVCFQKSPGGTGR